MIDDPEVVAYVNGIGQEVVRGLEDSFFDYQFAVVADPRINAFAVPGGYVYVHSGLLSRVDSDDELAAVLGHEAAHVHAHHLARQEEATKLLNYTALLGTLLSVFQPALGPLVTGASQAVALKYRREFEQEADYLGMRYLRNSRHDPRAMLDFFKKLANEQRTVPTFVPPYLQSHPLTDERLNHLEAVLRTQQWTEHERSPRSFALQRAQVVARVRSEEPLDVLEDYRNRIEKSRNGGQAMYLFGFACLEANRLDLAEKPLRSASQSGIAVADRDLGRLALRRRDPVKAQELLSAYAIQVPEDPVAQMELAKAVELSGDTDTAMGIYRRTLVLAPGLAAAHRELGLLSGRGGNQADGFYHLAAAAHLNGDYETALTQYERAEELLPKGDPRVDDVRGSIKELNGFLQRSTPREKKKGKDSPKKPAP